MTNDAPSGLILLDKKPGVTSFEALRLIKRLLGTGKVGHTGTLDKFAQGLLVVLAGRALKLCSLFSNCDKKYIGKIRFGAETDTLDPEGNIIAEAESPSREKVEEVLVNFTGNIMQEPPAYSAIHVNGHRASELARCGKIPEMKKRPVSVYKLELRNWEPPFAEIFVHCSSGTYIRSLARDIALAAGSRAFLCGLTRTQVAGFSLDMAKTLTENSEREDFLLPVDKSVIRALRIPWFEISSSEETEKIIHGKPLSQILDGKPLVTQFELPKGNDCIAAVFAQEKLAAIVEKSGNSWKYVCVLTN